MPPGLLKQKVGDLHGARWINLGARTIRLYSLRHSKENRSWIWSCQEISGVTVYLKVNKDAQYFHHPFALNSRNVLKHLADQGWYKDCKRRRERRVGNSPNTTLGPHHTVADWGPVASEFPLLPRKVLLGMNKDAQYIPSISGLVWEISMGKE